MDPLSFKFGNGDTIAASYAANVTLNLQGHNFQISCLAVANLKSISIVLDSKSIKELKSEINLEHNKIKFKSKNLGMKTAHDLTLKPGTTKDVKLYGLLPRTLHGKQLSLTIGKYLKPYTGSHTLGDYTKRYYLHRITQHQ